MNKIIIISIVIVVVVGVGAFYGGMKYEQSRVSAARSNFRNFTAGQGQQIGDRNGKGAGSNFITGEIISKDSKSITVKLQNGGSKIVFYSESTEISKFAAGTSADLETGESIMAQGSTNQDGSITAQSIQIRPEGTSRPQ